MLLGGLVVLRATNLYAWTFGAALNLVYGVLKRSSIIAMLSTLGFWGRFFFFRGRGQQIPTGPPLFFKNTGDRHRFASDSSEVEQASDIIKEISFADTDPTTETVHFVFSIGLEARAKGYSRQAFLCVSLPL